METAHVGMEGTHGGVDVKVGVKVVFPILII